MKHSETNNDVNEALPIKYFQSSSLIGSDTLKENHIERIEEEVLSGKKLDPVILYEYKGAKFILEGNQRAGTYWRLKMNVPCVIVRDENDYQKLRKMDIKIGKLEEFKTLKIVHSALAKHMRTLRKDIYLQYFAK